MIADPPAPCPEPNSREIEAMRHCHELDGWLGRMARHCDYIDCLRDDPTCPYQHPQ